TLASWTTNLAGETTLAAARQRASFPVRLPAYPQDLGQPNRVFLQNLDGPAVILVWLQTGHPDRVRMSLHQLSSDALAMKTISDMTMLQETAVHGQRALWVRGPHILQFYDSSGGRGFEPGRLVDGNTLIRTEGDITYRLET